MAVVAEKPIVDRYAASYPQQDSMVSPKSISKKTDGNAKQFNSGQRSLQNSMHAVEPSVNLVSEEEHYSEDFDAASGVNSAVVVAPSVKRDTKMDITSKPTADILRESPAFHIITAEPEGSVIESPFLANRKNLVKYNLSDELIQAFINVNEETKLKQKRDKKMKA